TRGRPSSTGWKHTLANTTGSTRRGPTPILSNPGTGSTTPPSRTARDTVTAAPLRQAAVTVFRLISRGQTARAAEATRGRRQPPTHPRIANDSRSADSPASAIASSPRTPSQCLDHRQPAAPYVV